MYDTGSTDLILPEKTCKTAATRNSIQQNHTHSPNQTFGVCDRFPQDFDTAPMHGILGLGIAPQSTTGGLPSFWSWYYSGQLPEPVFSFYIAPGLITGSVLTLGGIDHSKYTGEVIYVDLSRNISNLSQAFVMDLQTLYINDKEVHTRSTFNNNPLGDKKPAPAPFQPGLAALDTGTVIQTPDKQSAADIYSQISPLVKQIDPAGAWGAPGPILDAIAPNIKFAIGPSPTLDSLDNTGLFNLTLPSEFFNLGEYPSQPGICQAVFNSPVEMIQDPEGDRPVWIVGSPVLKAYCTVWDGLNLNVGFAKPVELNY
ncbi:aspartic peptidase domain-containing protein [Aspergillus spectabilis]